MTAIQKIHKQTSLPYYRSSSAFGDTSESDFATANEVFPMRVPLERVEIGGWKYVSSEYDDIELLYELESSDLVISTNVRGTGDGVPALFYIHSISAVDLSLVSVVPGSLESMVARLIIETDSKIRYKVKHSSLSPSDDKKEQCQELNDLDIEIVKITASVHESGHLRDVLLFMKCNYSAEMNPDQTYLRPRANESEVPTEKQDTPHLTFVEWLPYWVSYIPWMMYSKKNRKLLQLVILIYSVFTVIWAMWQLYRHVNIIRILMQPFIETLRVYLSSVLETFDWVFKVFTELWYTYLSPLNILRTILLAPLFNLVLELKTALSPFFSPIYQIMQNSGLLSIISTVSYLVGTLFYNAGSILISVFSLVLRPFFICWEYLINSRFVVASMDFQRLQFSWIFSLIINSFKAIFRGLLNLVGYKLREQKKKKAMMTAPTQAGGTPANSPVRSPGIGGRKPSNMPQLYSSPATKQD